MRVEKQGSKLAKWWYSKRVDPSPAVMLAAIAVEGEQVVQRTNLIGVVAIKRHRLNPEKADTPVSLGGRSGIVPEGEQSIGCLDRRSQMAIQKQRVEFGFVLYKIVPVLIERK